MIFCNFVKGLLAWGITCVALVILGACSDDSSSFVESEQEEAFGPPISERSIYELGKCNDKKLGIKVFVEEEFAYYVCAQRGLWIKISIEDIEEPQSGTSEMSWSSASEESFPGDEDYEYSSEGATSSSSGQCVADIHAWHTEGFYAQPNDEAPQDSADSYVAIGGVYLKLPAAGKYSLSIKKDPSIDAPPKLQLFAGYASYDKTVDAADSLGRWYYSFETPYSFTDYQLFRTMLVDENCEIPLVQVQDFKLEGEGKYSTHFNVNVIQVGKYMGTSDGASLESLVSAVKSRFNEAMNGGGVYVDNVTLLKASEHPTFGSDFSSDSGYVLPYSTYNTDYSILSSWSGHENALNIILGYYIESESTLGFAGRFSAGLNGAPGSRSYVIAGTHYKKGKSIKKSSAADIVNTIVHEAGHYLGLRHTSASEHDLAQDGDQSNVEDGIEDTPYCKVANTSSDEYKLKSCGDRNNIVFPYSSEERDVAFTAGQMNMLRKNISLMEH